MRVKFLSSIVLQGMVALGVVIHPTSSNTGASAYLTSDAKPSLLPGIVSARLCFCALPRIGTGSNRRLRNLLNVLLWYDIDLQIDAIYFVAKGYALAWQSQLVLEGKIGGSFIEKSGSPCSCQPLMFRVAWAIVPWTLLTVHVNTHRGLDDSRSSFVSSQHLGTSRFIRTLYALQAFGR